MKSIAAEYSLRPIVCSILFMGLSLSVSACLLPQSETVTSRHKVYRRPVDVDSRVKFHVNQVGYDVNGPKKAIMESVGEGSVYDLVDASTKKVVYSGKLIPTDQFVEWGGGPYYHIVDFTAYQTESVVQIKVKEYYSHEFKIQKNVLYHETFQMVLDYFKKSRANNPNVLRTDANVPFFDSERTADVRGGWYDASGDISKYLTHLSYANLMNPQQIPLTAWALAWVYDNANETLLSEGVKSQLAEEAVWGADYLVRVLDTAGYFYINVFDHWSGDMYQRRICAFETKSGTMTSDWQAAFREGGGLAIAALARASMLNAQGEFTPEKYLESAKAGFAHLQRNNLKYTDDGKENVIDDYAALLAAAELHAATGDAEYLDTARARAKKLVSRLHSTGYFVADDGGRPFWHASDAGLPVVALMRYYEVESDSARQKEVAAAISTHLNYQLKVTTSVENPFGYARQHFTINGKVKSGFFIPHENETGYWWQGENARLSSLAAAAMLGRKFMKDSRKKAKLQSFAADQLSWVLGMNPFGYCFLKGAGTTNPVPYATFPNDKNHADLDGGIANGITGSNQNGEGIEFWGAPGMSVRNEFRWRWLEQWLPHSTWYLVAITAVSQNESVPSE
ncbi:MAG: glycoside hydrolase family 9 protein [Deltaproteobacteria bacterium]|nr:glycoside hydrolase family 9 protein [Deltaproteobacteria bacterium]MBN2672498.1 glycoside hydrolase family 9 protein [Deltaproteobacteria bacterium]